ncbi:MAG: hypothetical protein J6B98_07210 [Bacilli bacterium]|nr:hypothetical protein [Bacilli bacterium]
MIITDGIIEYVKYLNIKKEKLEKEITNFGNSTNIKNKFKINQLKEQLAFIVKLIKIFEDNNSNKFIFRMLENMEYIYNSSASLPVKLECICFILNAKYSFYNNESNLDDYLKKDSDISDEEKVKKFYIRKKEYSFIKSIITDDNRVVAMKEVSDEYEYILKGLGVPTEIVGLIIDSSLRNYEYEKIYESGGKLKI